jgi:hypothetical protein
MGDHKVARQERRIEASEQERAALGLFLNEFAPDNRHDRDLCDDLHSDFEIRAARDALIAALKEKGDAPIADRASPDFVEYPTTNQVIDYLMKITDTKIHPSLAMHIHTLEKRVEDLRAGKYTAPSQRVPEIASVPAVPALAAVPAAV